MRRTSTILAAVLLMGCNVFFDRDSVSPPADDDRGGTAGTPNGTTTGTTNGTTTGPSCGATDCTVDLPVCDEANETCVECLIDDDCGWRRCETESMVCVDCLVDGDCNGNRFCTADFVCEK